MPRPGRAPSRRERPGPDRRPTTPDRRPTAPAGLPRLLAAAIGMVIVALTTMGCAAGGDDRGPARASGLDTPAGAPTGDAPGADEPGDDAPGDDAPGDDEPRADEPRADEPRGDGPRSDQDRSVADDPSRAVDGADVRVVVSTTVFADLAGQILDGIVEVSSLVPVGGDPHVHEPTPRDARLLQDADLVIHNGLGLEPWLEPLLARAQVPTLVLGDAVGATTIDGDADGPDPHLWMAPPYAQRYLTHIADALTEVLPDQADEIAHNLEAATAALTALDSELAERLAVIEPERRKLVTSHDAYAYFAAHYDLEVIGTVVGVSTDEEPSARRVRALVDTVRDSGVPTVFVESTVSPAVLEAIARDAGVEVGDPLYGDSLGPPGSGAEDYSGMLRANVAALVAGLGP